MARAGAISRKPISKAEANQSPTPQLALNILQFCDAHDISEGFYYKMKKQGLGPREMKLGSRTLITFEAAADWRHEREIASARNSANTAAPLSAPAAVPPPTKVRGRRKSARSAQRDNASA